MRRLRLLMPVLLSGCTWVVDEQLACHADSECQGAQQCVARRCVPRRGSGVRGDFDGDGLSDLVFQDAAFEVMVQALRRDGSTVSAGGQSATDPSRSPAGWRVAATPDWDRDGWPDFALQNRTSNKVVYWTLNGGKRTDGGFLSPEVPAAGLVVGSGDFNLDGAPDLFFADDPATSPDGGATATAFSGFTAVAPAWLEPRWPAAANNRLAAVCDATGDGKPDALWQNTTSGRISLWALEGVTRTRGSLLPEDIGDAGWALRACADFDLNGVDDLGFQRVGASQVKLVMLSDAGVVLSTADLEPGIGYELVGPR